MVKKSRISFFILLMILLPLEWMASIWAYENYGWYVSALCRMAMGLNMIWSILFIFRKANWAFMVTVALGLFLIAPQWIMKRKHQQLQVEAESILNYINQFKFNNDQFPEELDRYVFHNPNLSSHFQYCNEVDDFLLPYHVGSKSTHHFYRYQLGGLNYYDD